MAAVGCFGLTRMAPPRSVRPEAGPRVESYPLAKQAWENIPTPAVRLEHLRASRASCDTSKRERWPSATGNSAAGTASDASERRPSAASDAAACTASDASE